jgi:hypothetical protein
MHGPALRDPALRAQREGPVASVNSGRAAQREGRAAPAVATAPVPPPVPQQYSQGFAMSDGSVGSISYDWPGRRQRVDHVGNTAHRTNQCWFWFNTTGPCTEYFTPDGEVFVHFPADGSCCLESCEQTCPTSWNVSDGSCCREPPTGLPRPDSAAQCAFNSTVTYQGRPAEWFHCPACLNYLFSPPSEWSSMTPLLFFADDRNYEVRFDVPSLRPGPVPESTFALPPSCTRATKCRGFTAKPSLVCGARPHRFP